MNQILRKSRAKSTLSKKKRKKSLFNKHIDNIIQGCMERLGNKKNNNHFVNISKTLLESYGLDFAARQISNRYRNYIDPELCHEKLGDQEKNYVDNWIAEVAKRFNTEKFEIKWKDLRQDLRTKNGGCLRSENILKNYFYSKKRSLKNREEQEENDELNSENYADSSSSGDGSVSHDHYVMDDSRDDMASSHSNYDKDHDVIMSTAGSCDGIEPTEICPTRSTCYECQQQGRTPPIDQNGGLQNHFYPKKRSLKNREENDEPYSKNYSSIGSVSRDNNTASSHSSSSFHHHSPNYDLNSLPSKDEGCTRLPPISSIFDLSKNSMNVMTSHRPGSLPLLPLCNDSIYKQRHHPFYLNNYIVDAQSLR